MSTTWDPHQYARFSDHPPRPPRHEASPHGLTAGLRQGLPRSAGAFWHTPPRVVRVVSESRDASEIGADPEVTTRGGLGSLAALALPVERGPRVGPPSRAFDLRLSTKRTAVAGEPLFPAGEVRGSAKSSAARREVATDPAITST